ncbi:MAG: NAD(P)-dependent alcohol dehydrogenase, partial [Ignavibacteria bacterium]|nr:NAD(P)-dependent alcohol dehydrogenase [Ignavibacteria bacterium]
MKISGFAAYEKKSELKPYQYEPNELGRKEVLIKITHCGICHSDIHLIDDDWRVSQYPFIPGHEIIGEIVGIGSEVERLKVGQRVGVGWQSGSCLECEWCASGFENLCSKQVATCVGRNGGFADYVVTDSRFAFPIPEKLTSENAAPLLCGGITVYSPLRRYNVKPKDRVGVIGIGGLGHLAIQFARAMGCEVTAFSTSPDKEKEAIELGAHKFIQSNDEKQMKKLESSLDFIISTVYTKLNWLSYINVLKPNGNLCFVGANFDNLDIPAGVLLLGQKQVSGSVIGGRAIISEMLEFSER